MSSQSLDPMQMRAWCYVLELENDGFYVGVTKDLCRRLEEHWTQRAAQYTRTHKPVRVHALHRCEGSGADVLTLERRVTLDLMAESVARHGADGWNRVRGGPWCSPAMQQPPRELSDHHSQQPPLQ